MATLTIDGNLPEHATAEQLASRLRVLDMAAANEIWAGHSGESGPQMCALIHRGERGWLMFVGEPGDAGFSTRNPDYNGEQDAMLSFRLSNGQEDMYPAAWTYSLATLRAAFVQFLETGARPDNVRWYDDSELAMVAP